MEQSPTIPPDIHCGQDGWLFLTGGTNRVLRYYTSPDAFPESTVQRWLAVLRERRERSLGLGTKYLHIIAPEKLTIYYDKFNGELPYRLQSPAYRLPAVARTANLGNLIVDLLPYFMRQKMKYKLFWQTDTHWTFEGCFCAYQIICSCLGIDPVPLRGITTRGPLVLDLGGKLDPPLREEFSAVSFLQRARRVYANPVVAYKERTGRENDGGLHVGSNVVFQNTSETAYDMTVVLFGDSFAEYRPHLLTGMLAETFRELHFVWSASIDWSYIERVKPDLLFTETAERFAAQVPVDDFDLAHYESKIAELFT